MYNYKGRFDAAVRPSKALEHNMRFELRKAVTSFVFGGAVGAGGVVVSVLLSRGSLSSAVRSQALGSGLFLGTIFSVGSLIR